MKLLHIVSGNLYGGVEALLVTLAKHRALEPAMQPSFALCFNGRLSEELEIAGATPLVLGSVRASRPWSIIRARRKLRALIGERRPDAAITHGVWTQAMFGSVLRETAVPSSLFLHDVARGRHWVERWASFSRPDAVIANSHFTAATAPLLYPRLEPGVYYCPVPARTPESGERERVRAELGIEPDRVLVLQASRMQAWKGQREHLLSLAKLKHLPQWISVQAGGPQRPTEEPYFDELKQLARELGIADRVKFLGQRSDVPRLLSGADIYFQPNAGAEPFGIAFIEAMLAGLPLVTFRLGGPAEFVTEEVGFAAVVQGELVTALASLIQSTDLRSKLGRNGQRRAHHLCDPSRQLPALAQLVEEKLGTSSSAVKSQRKVG